MHYTFEVLKVLVVVEVLPPQVLQSHHGLEQKAPGSEHLHNVPHQSLRLEEGLVVRRVVDADPHEDGEAHALEDPEQVPPPHEQGDQRSKFGIMVMMLFLTQ